MRRDSFFDVLKFFAMFLVVLGHVYWAFGSKTLAPYFENFRCGMNMPLFFMIAGYFAERTIDAGDWRKLVTHIYGYFWPVAMVSFVFAVFAVLFQIPGSEKGFIGYAGRRFLFSPWFLWCLAICYSLTFLCCRAKSRAWSAASFMLIIVVLPFLKGVWHMGNVRAMLPHFIIGAFVLRRWELWKIRWFGGLCLFTYLASVLLQGDITNNGLSFYQMETTWNAFFSDATAFPLYLVRIVNGVVGSIGIMWALQELCNGCKVVTRLAPLGMTTLWVYILHQWLLDRVVGLDWGDSSLCMVVFWSGALFVVCHLCGYVVRRVLEHIRQGIEL